MTKLSKTMNDCRFCEIINGDRENEEIILEDDNFIVIIDRYRRTSVGLICLIIPKEHKQNILELDKGDELLKTINTIGKSIQQVFNSKGLRIWTAVNKEAGQSIFHCHIHVVPCKSILDRLIVNFPGVYDIVMRLTRFGKRHNGAINTFKLAERLRIAVNKK